jgi:hypothetical protein
MTDIGVVAMMALLVIAVVAVVWVLRSTPKQGQKVLQRWGIANPTEEQGRIAADYLKRRRNLFPYVAIAVFALTVLGQWLFSTADSIRWEGVLLFAIVASLLVAELLATLRRPTDRQRSATLTPRRFTDIVPKFGLVALGILALIAVAVTVAIVAALPFAKAVNAWRERHAAELQKLDAAQDYPIDIGMGSAWFALLAFAICVIAALGVVRLCQVRGPLTSDLAVDAALRIRSGRVALGTAVLLGSGLVATITGTWWDIATVSQPVVEIGAQLTADLPPTPDWIRVLRRPIGWYNFAGFAFLLVWVILISPWRTQRLVAAHT